MEFTDVAALWQMTGIIHRQALQRLTDVAELFAF